MSHLPEHHFYRDTGCTLHPKCLTCPFETCRFDDSTHTLGRGQAHQKLIGELLTMGVNYTQIATQLSVSIRTVKRLANV